MRPSSIQPMQSVLPHPMETNADTHHHSSVAAAPTVTTSFPPVLKSNQSSTHYTSTNSDSNYVAVSRFTRQPFSKAATYITLDMVDDDWAADTLSDDEVETARPEAVVAPMLEEGELDQDAIVVSPTGNSALAANNAAERRRREEGWNDLGLDQIDSIGRATLHAAQTRMHNTQD
ncbi:Apc13p protein [Nitzschia inconspicua]|uniref:Apc13p protein n=1 Tax=Nitzschia inconspicua TaxID=303405 RepID=A0A9K3L3Z1_9STRA|nr:Apc13p protein [Nitzschia inconspicua]